MKIQSIALVAALAIGAQSQLASAQGGLTCPQLDEAARELTDLLNTLEAQGVVQENSSFDQRLDIASETAVQFAYAEGDGRLIGLANGMRTGWEIKNIDLYLANGDDMIDIYDRLYDRDC
ncbi:MAG: hypothetical protein AAF280_14965 [Pseudomonadota bacterium]